MVSGDDCHVGRSVRKSQSKSSSSKSRKTESDVVKFVTLGNNDPQPSVHKRNLYVVSLPVIILFNILRSILYQLFVIFKYIYTASYRILHRPRRNGECNLEIVVREKTDSTDQLLTSDTMSVPRTSGPGPGDPLLAKQKHHHRRAFEYISKALKIDEENEGQKELAIELYKKGIGELEQGIAVECWGGRGEAWQRAQRLHDKMQTNLGMARDRLHFLVSLEELARLGLKDGRNAPAKVATRTARYRPPGTRPDNTIREGEEDTQKHRLNTYSSPQAPATSTKALEVSGRETDRGR